VTIRRATVADIDVLAPLFDAYRQFYRQRSEPEGARRFLGDRMERDESIVFLAFDGETAIGFTQLYPSFSSASMARIFVLNDLFITPEARRGGTGSALLRAAADYGRSAGAVRLMLSTELTNTTAQAAYEKNGWKRDTVFCVYQLAL
jgi:GNAT superfamily N-acetyltransferase